MIPTLLVESADTFGTLSNLFDALPGVVSPRSNTSVVAAARISQY